MEAGSEAAMRKIQTAAIILFCLWSVGMIVYSILELRSLGRDLESLRPEAGSDLVFEPTESSEEHETEPWVDAYVYPSLTRTTLVSLGALWFFPAFFFLCVFLFARLKTRQGNPVQSAASRAVAARP
jgi:preprotein translocase subunit SecG